MYQAVICDLDGTLLNAEHTISEYTRDIISKVRNKGIIICIATGRHHIDARVYQQMLNLDSFLITSNGAKIHDEKGREIYSANIPEKTAWDLIHTVVDSDIVRHVFQDDEWYCEQPWLITSEAYKDSGVKPVNKPFYLIKGPITKFCYEYQRRPNKLLQLEELLLERFGDKLSISFSSPIFLELMTCGVSKGAAIQRILKSRNIDASETIAFGDGLNDFEMLKYVGKGILMGNCDGALPNMLPECEIIGSNEDDGLARYLEKLYLG